MQTITTIGLDIAKSVFQIHVVDAGGQVAIRRQLHGHTPRLRGSRPCASGLASLMRLCVSRVSCAGQKSRSKGHHGKVRGCGSQQNCLPKLERR
jgi:hypothetical protein